MYCGNCGAKVVGAFCTACGARSAQAELVQTAQRQRTFAEKHPFVTVAMVIGVCFVALMIVAVKNTPADTPTGPEYGHTKFACACATSSEDVWPVVRAYRSQDAPALQGL